MPRLSAGASMRAGRFITVIAGAWLAQGVAHAEPVTIWLTESSPEERFLQKADRQTGGTLHLWTIDLRYPPAPLTADDEGSVERVLAAVEAGRAVWEEFEIEQKIAVDVQAALDGVGVLTEERDRADLVRALLFQGTAVARAFDPELFPTSAAAAPFRTTHDGADLPTPWVDAYALSRTLAARGDLVDGTGWYHYQEVAPRIQALPPASLEVPDGIGDVFVDGAKVEPGLLSLPPGRHYVHVARGGVIHGRAVVRLAPGEALPFPSAVTPDDLASARERVLEGKRAGIPDPVTDAAATLSRYYNGALFLGAVDGNRSELVGFGSGALLKDNQLVTVVLNADAGGGAVIGLGGGDGVSPIFPQANDPAVVDNPGSTAFAGAVTASLGLEVGVSYFLAAAGVDVHVTPGRTIRYSIDGENRHTSVYANPWGGIGAYAVRPTKRTATLAIMGTAGWMSPAHAVYGGRIIVGVPVDDRTWFRVSVGGGFGPATVWNDTTTPDRQPIATAWLRIGYGARL